MMTSFLRPGNILSGWLPHGENLTLDRGFYSSQGSLFINGSLNIKPGVVIGMDANASLVVDFGSIMAAGDVDDPIFLQSLSDEPWRNVIVQSTAISALFQNIIITGSGSSSAPALLIQKSATFTNVNVSDCLGGSLEVSGYNDKHVVLDGFYSYNTTAGPGTANIYLTGNSTVTLANGFLSSQGWAELYAEGSVNLTMNSVIISPQYPDGYGLYLQNSFTDIVGLDFKTTFAYYGTPVEIWNSDYFSTGYATDFSMRFSSIRIPDNPSGIALVSHSNWWYRYRGSMTLEDNDFSAQQLFSFLALINIPNVTLQRNHFASANLTNSLSILSSSSILVQDNEWNNISCHSDHCLWLDAPQVTFTGNSFIATHVAAPNAIVSFISVLVHAVHNHFANSSGHMGILLRAAPSKTNFTDNIISDGSQLTWLIGTETHFNFGQSADQIYYIGPNYWGLTSFPKLRSSTFDCLIDSGVVCITYSGLYSDGTLQDVIEASPVPTNIIEMSNMTVGGAILQAATVSIPEGVYYAPNSVILQHPNASLTLEPGVKIMFAPTSSIQVRDGELRILGTADKVVQLCSTDEWASEYPFADLDLFSQWEGLWFGPQAKPSILVGRIFVDGSTVQHCRISNAGYGNAYASVHLHVPIFMQHVCINGSGTVGMYAYYLDETLTLDDVNISFSESYGIVADNHNNVIISFSHFEGNCMSGMWGCSQVYSLWGRGPNFFNISTSVISNASSTGLDFFLFFGYANVVGVEFYNLQRPLYYDGQTWDYNGVSYGGDVSISLCHFISSRCTDCSAVDVTFEGFLLFERNLIEGNDADKIIRFYGRDSYVGLQARIESNIFRNNTAAESQSGRNAVLSLESGSLPSYWQVSKNEFDDLGSQYEITTYGYEGSNPTEMVVNLNDNLFHTIGDVTNATVDSRIYDDDEDPRLPKVAMGNFLTPDPGNTTKESAKKIKDCYTKAKKKCNCKKKALTTCAEKLINNYKFSEGKAGAKEKKSVIKKFKKAQKKCN